jgi:hypothetical protein
MFGISIELHSHKETRVRMIDTVEYYSFQLSVSKCVQLYPSLHFQLFAHQDSNLRRKLHPYAQEDLLISVN